jgi:transcriptional regulator with XRE-family HTH domain
MAYIAAMNLLQWRKKKDLTMAEAADVLDISQPTISRIESGAQLPNPGTITKLAEKSAGAITGPDLYRAWEAAQRAGAA